jgi:hypothetical protein
MAIIVSQEKRTTIVINNTARFANYFTMLSYIKLTKNCKKGIGNLLEIDFRSPRVYREGGRNEAAKNDLLSLRCLQIEPR